MKTEKKSTTLRNFIDPLKVEQHITAKLANIYAEKESFENLNVTESVKIEIQQMTEFQQGLSKGFHERLM